ncbi:MAG: sulfite oxidase [Gemmataceae bacterium]|nr:sulfite oxidase [Gemmataceae bacterium]
MATRREFLTTAAVGTVAGAPAESTEPAPAPIVREFDPLNAETPTHVLGTPQGDQCHFIRSHFPVPHVDMNAWRLVVEGAVEKPQSFTLTELRKLPTVTRKIAIECAGNSRVYLTPKVRGVNWANGAVGQASWTGIPLAAVLERAGVRNSAVEVVLEGADSGTHADEPKSPGIITYARSLPISKAMKPETLLALEMNGKPLTAHHGAPLRAVVGGWYGMAGVKWLTRIIVADKPFQGYWQTMDYSQFDRVNGIPTLVPITAMRVKSVITSPTDRQDINSTTVRGLAWAGEQAVAHVDVSADGGTTWQRARLLGEARPFEWVAWSMELPALGRDRITLMSRATDSNGLSQPLTRDGDRRTYQINHVIPISVNVR